VIFDHISNLETYRDVDPDIYAGLKYLRALKPSVDLGEYQVTPNVKALVTSYDTKVENEGRYEAHRYVIDVQYPIVGREGVEWSALSGMKEVEAADAHNPQRAVNGVAGTIKKVTLKVKVKAKVK
jgi:beta-galactosidase beta subunit